MAYASVDELAGALRIRVTAENTPGLQLCLDAAALEIDHDIDRPATQSAPSAPWLFSSATAAADPGPGELRLNKSNPAATSRLFLDTIDADGVDHQDELADVQVNDLLRLYGDSLHWEQFTVTDLPTDHGGWFEIPVSRSDSSPTPLELLDGIGLMIYALRPSVLLREQLALANRVNILRGVEWFKANDAAFGVIGFDQTGALQAPRDGFNRHAYTLTPLKQQWGLA